MFRLSWKGYSALILIGLSIILFAIHTVLFRDVKTLEFYLALDLVFLPLQVLLVTFIIERILNEREKQARLKKLNMVIGPFFSEVGLPLIRQMTCFCANQEAVTRQFSPSGRWKKGDYKSALKIAETYAFGLDPQRAQFQELRRFLLLKRGPVMGMLQNPHLLEHEMFTDLLWAVCHLTEELELRTDFGVLPLSDLNHLREDAVRAYGLLVRQWLFYLQHLRDDYPYIYSLALRNNPFDPNPVLFVSE